MNASRHSVVRILPIIGFGTILSLVYSALNYTVQIALVELFGFHLRGVFEILMSIIGLVSIIFSFNFYTSINLHISQNKSIPKNLKKISLIILSAQIVGVLAFYTLSKTNAAITNEKRTLFLLVLLAATFLNHKVNEFTAVLNGHQYFMKAKLLSLYGVIFSAVTIALSYLLGLKDENLIVCIATLTPFIGSYIYIFILKIGLKKQFVYLNLFEFKSLYTENTGIYIISLAQFISIKLFLIYLASSENLEIVGIFSLTYSILQFILLPATFLATIILSTNTNNLNGFLKIFKIIFGYGVISGVFFKIAIDIGLLQIFHLASLNNPKFLRVLDTMLISIPFCITNIFIVAVAARKNMCTKPFVLIQALAIPLILTSYYIAKNIFVLEVAVSTAFVVTLSITSILGFRVLKNEFRKGIISNA